MEYCDLYDENRRPLGVVIARGDAVPPDAYLLSVGIWVVNDQRQVLITRRSPQKRYAPGKWENPAGHVQAGEDEQDAIIRELQEETGVAARRENMHFLGSARVWPFFGDNYLVRMNVPIENVRLQPGETCDAKWVTIAQLEAMMQNGDMAPSTLAHWPSYCDAFYRCVNQTTI